MPAFTLTEWLGLMTPLVVGGLTAWDMAFRADHDGIKTASFFWPLSWLLMALALWYPLAPWYGVEKYWSAASLVAAAAMFLVVAVQAHMTIALRARGELSQDMQRLRWKWRATRLLCVFFAAMLLSPALWLSLRPEGLDAKIAQLREQKNTLEHRVEGDIPRFDRRLQKQAQQVHGLLKTADRPSARQEHQEEMEDIARLMIALENYRREVESTIARLDALGRKLQRAKAAGQILGAIDADLVNELDAATREARARLSVEVNEQIGHGTIEQLHVQRKIAELTK